MSAVPSAARSAATRLCASGQQAEASIYYMKARFYDPVAGRFLQPDTIVPDYRNPQALNRYSYVYNNPLRYNDPTGRCANSLDFWSGCADVVANLVGDTSSAIGNGFNVLWDYVPSAAVAAAQWIASSSMSFGQSVANVAQQTPAAVIGAARTGAPIAARARQVGDIVMGHSAPALSRAFTGINQTIPVVAIVALDLNATSLQFQAAMATDILAGIGCAGGVAEAGLAGCAAGAALGYSIGYGATADLRAASFLSATGSALIRSALTGESPDMSAMLALSVSNPVIQEVNLALGARLTQTALDINWSRGRVVDAWTDR